MTVPVEMSNCGVNDIFDFMLVESAKWFQNNCSKLSLDLYRNTSVLLTTLYCLNLTRTSFVYKCDAISLLGWSIPCHFVHLYENSFLIQDGNNIPRLYYWILSEGIGSCLMCI